MAGRKFRLYSVDHVDHCCDSMYYPTRYIEFYHLDEKELQYPCEKHKPSNKKGERKLNVHGHIYFNSSTVGDLKTFVSPKRASLDYLKLNRSGHTIEIMFISDDYVKVKVRRETVHEGVHNPTTTGQKEYEFAGIYHDVGDRIRNLLKKRGTSISHNNKKSPPKRTPSPGETWFEMNDPMGSWEQSRMEEAVSSLAKQSKPLKRKRN